MSTVPVPKRKKHRMTKTAKREMTVGYLYLLPNFIGFLVFTAIPIITGFVLSFTNYNGYKGSFVGIANYAKLLRDTQFKTAFSNNMVYSFVSVPLTILFALLLALALNRKMPFANAFKTVCFFPNLTSMVAVGCVSMLLFMPTNGPINNFLSALGVPEESLPQWFFSTKSAMTTIIIIVVWKQAGYYMIMFMGGLKNIPSFLYEAAEIDGANSWQLFRNVTWPMLSPTTFMVTILCFISSFQVFDIINVTTEGGPGRATTVIVFRIYQEAFKNGKMGYASSQAYVLFVIILAITLIQWRGQKRWVNVD